jgi:putative redox protein
MTVVSKWIDGYKCRATALDLGHEIICDEPPVLGGKNEGLNPFALLKMSLANCVVGTLVGVCRARDVDLKGLTVRVVHKQNTMAPPTEDLARTVKIIELRCSIDMKAEVTPEDKEALRWAAEHCPVANSLAGAIPIEHRLDVSSL